MSIVRNCIALACLITGALAPNLAAAQAALAPEFRVNPATPGNQGLPVVASAADGRFVVVWESDKGSARLNDIYAQRYAADGTPIGGQFRINSESAERQGNAAVAMNASGEFVVVWNSATHLPATTGVFAQRYAADGTPRGGQLRVNTGERDIYALVSVAIGSNGDFIVAWPERGKSLPVATNVVPGFIVAQRYSADGVAKEAAITVQNSYINNLRVPSVGIDEQGGFVVAWNSDSQVGLLTPTTNLGQFLGVYARRYGADGKPLGAGFQADVSTSGIAVDRPVLAVAPDGSFALAWQTNAPDSTPRGIMLRRYGVDGAALGAPVAVDAEHLLRKPALAANAAGQIVVAAYSDGLYLRRYDADGTAGATIRADGGTTSNAILQPAIASDAAGNLVAAWQVYGLDGSGRAVYARRFAP
ncbi:MAG: hypothetical protein JWQ90_2195 [Hydrocarboniphaga sp.]|uniref:hypothetical protein n=1 Tax=Hydrocarboniphaga sp. TaxID=2033016 RepID=UPI0026102A91|nr:hypothetical protein [Hydrocarboniphaga sp.]MDB5969745.1 hypothetical protein [Hydrocarboniphaga sp.]